MYKILDLDIPRVYSKYFLELHNKCTNEEIPFM